MYIDVHEDSENAISAKANVSLANVKRSGRSQHRATQQMTPAAVFRSAPGSAPAGGAGCAGKEGGFDEPHGGRPRAGRSRVAGDAVQLTSSKAGHVRGHFPAFDAGSCVADSLLQPSVVVLSVYSYLQLRICTIITICSRIAMLIQGWIFIQHSGYWRCFRATKKPAEAGLVSGVRS